MNGNTCPTHLLTDDPSDRDALGSHQRVATLLADTVTEQRGGRAIALIGPYGAGKSTIVSLLEREFDERNNAATQTTKVFVYDAWAHQGDPLRRSFLEELRKFLISSRWIEPKTLKSYFDALSKRTQNTETTSSPALTFAGVLVALSFFAVPLGSDLIRGNDGWGYALSFAPVIVSLAIYLFYRPLRNPFSAAFWTCQRTTWKFWLAEHWVDADGSSSVPFTELLWKKTRETISATSITPLDPTSVEFSRLFTGVIGRALLSDRRRLVVVLDNLDRLEHGEALKIISTMRIFFEAAGANEHWGKNFWVLVPFSPGWTAQFGDDKIVEPGDVEMDVFLEKSFQIRINIGEPPLSNWKAFLHDELLRACPQHENDFAAIYLLYSKSSGDKRDLVTPRAIKHFVNRLAMSHREWQDDIPLPTQAAFLLQRQQTIDAWIKSAGKTDIFDVSEESDLGNSDWRNHFAALYFNVDISQAAQVLMGDSIRSALNDGEVSTIRELMGRPGFLAVCERVITEDANQWVSKSPRLISMAAFAIAKSGVAGADSIIYPRLRNAFKRVDSWNIVGAASGQGIVEIVKSFAHSEQGNALNAFLQRFVAPPTITPQFPTDPTEVKEWLDAICPVLQWAHESNVAIAVGAFRVRSGPQFYVDALFAAAERTDSAPFVPRLIPESPVQDVVTTLMDRFRDDLTADRALAILQLLQRVAIEWPYGFGARLLAEDVGNVNPLSPSRARSECSALLYLASVIQDDIGIQQMRLLIQNGLFLHHLYQGINDPTTLALGVYGTIRYGAPTQFVGNASSVWARIQQVFAAPTDASNEEIIAALSRLASDYGGLKTHVLDWRNNQALLPLISALLSHDLKKHGYDLRLSGFGVVEDHDLLKGLIPRDVIEQAWRVAAGYHNIDTEIIAAGFSPEKQDLYEAVLGQPLDSASNLLDFLASATSRISTDEWLRILREEPQRLTSVAALVRAGKTHWLRHSFKDALEQNAKDVIIGTNYPRVLDQQWDDILNALDEPRLKVLLRDVSNELLKADRLNEEIFAVYGDALIRSGVLEEENPDHVTLRLFRKLLLSRQPWAIEVLDKLLSRYIDILESADTASSEDFVQKVAEVASEPTLALELRPLVQRILARLDDAGFTANP